MNEKDFCDELNAYFHDFFHALHQTSHLYLKIEFCADFVITHSKNSMYYRLMHSGKIEGPDANNNAETIEKMIKHLPLRTKSDYVNFRLAMVYMYDWCYASYNQQHHCDKFTIYYNKIAMQYRCNRNFEFTIEEDKIASCDDIFAFDNFFLHTFIYRDYIFDNADCIFKYEINLLLQIVKKSLK